MPRAYSSDLRRRVIAAALRAGCKDEVARRFAVGRASVHRWLAAVRDEGRFEARPVRGGPEPPIRGEAEATLRRLVESDDDLTLAEDRDRLAADAALRVHPWTVGRSRRRLRLTRKKKTLRAAARAGPAVPAERSAWGEAMAGAAPERLVFPDESAALTDMVRGHARSRRGERARGTAPGGSPPRSPDRGRFAVG